MDRDIQSQSYPIRQNRPRIDLLTKLCVDCPFFHCFAEAINRVGKLRLAEQSTSLATKFNNVPPQITFTDELLDKLALRVAIHLHSFGPKQTSDEWLIAKQAAEVLKVSISKLETMTRDKLVPSHKLGRTRRYKRSELLAISSAAAPLSRNDPPSVAQHQMGGPVVPSHLPELHAMFRRPYALALDTMHVADGKWKFFSHGLVLSLLDLKSDPDGSKSVTALHDYYATKVATGPTSSSSGTAEDEAPAKPQPGIDNDAQS